MSSNNNNTNPFFTIEDYAAHSRVFPNRSTILETLYASPWNFSSEPTNFQSLENLEHQTSAVQQVKPAPQTQTTKTPKAQAASAKQNPNPDKKLDQDASAPTQQHQQAQQQKEKKKVTINLEATTSTTALNEGDWPFINVTECDAILKNNSGKSLADCTSTIPVALHELYAPVYQSWLRDQRSFESDFEANPQHKKAFDALCLALANEQSAYQNRVADAAIKCANDETCCGKGCDKEGEIGGKKCLNHNFLPLEAENFFQAKQRSSSADDHLSNFACSFLINKILSFGTKIGSVPCRVATTFENSKYPISSSIVVESSISNKSRHHQHLIQFSSTIFFPPQDLSVLISKQDQDEDTAAPESTTNTKNNNNNNIISKLLESPPVANNSQTSDVCFTLRALESLASTGVQGAASPQSCITGTVYQKGTTKKSNAFLYHFDTAIESDEISRREVIRSFVEHKLIVGGEGENNPSDTKKSLDELIVKVDLVDFLQELMMLSQAQTDNNNNKKKKGAGKAQEQSNNKTQQQKQKQQEGYDYSATKQTSFYLRVPILGRNSFDMNAPVALLVKPEYSIEKQQQQSSFHRLEKFTASEVLYMFLVLRCVSRISIKVVRVSAYDHNRVLAVETINLHRLNLIIHQMHRAKEAEFQRVFALISGIVSKIRNLASTTTPTTSPEISISTTSLISLVRPTDSADILFFQHLSKIASPTLSRIAPKLSTQGLRKSTLPVDSWDVQSKKRLVLTFPTSISSSASKQQQQQRDDDGTSLKTIQGEEEVFHCLHSSIQYPNDYFSITMVNLSQQQNGDEMMNDDDDDKLLIQKYTIAEADAAVSADDGKKKKTKKIMGTGSRTKGLHF